MKWTQIQEGIKNLMSCYTELVSIDEKTPKDEIIQKLELHDKNLTKPKQGHTIFDDDFNNDSIYSLFKPEPEARITCKVYRYPYSRFPTPLLSCGTTPLLSNIRFAVLRAAHEARSAEVERSDQLGRNNLPAALT